MIGKVKWFNNGKGIWLYRSGGWSRRFCFIIPQFKVSDIALYQKEIPSKFEIVGGPKGPQAANVERNLSEHSFRKE